MNLRWNRQLVIDYKNVFGSPEGKRVLTDLVRRCPLLKEGVKTVGGLDVNQLLVQEGYSNVIKYIYKMINRDPNEEARQATVNEVKVEGI